MDDLQVAGGQLTPHDAPTREQIERLEGFLLELPQADLGTTHQINGGMYARTIFIPAGVTLTGAAHKTDHINVLHGDITVWTEAGMRRLTGYHVLPTKAGAKRAGHAHADTYWTTIVRTDLTDVEAIENEVVENPEALQTRRALPGADRAPELEN